MMPFQSMQAPVTLLPKVRSATLMSAANGAPCSLRLPGVCNHMIATTVWAHLPGIGKGVGTKGSDLHGCFACSACHFCIDGRTWEKRGLSDAYVIEAMLRALAESQARLVAAGIITVKNQKLV
jgi:hypothetical protein